MVVHVTAQQLISCHYHGTRSCGMYKNDKCTCRACKTFFIVTYANLWRSNRRRNSLCKIELFCFNRIGATHYGSREEIIWENALHAHLINMHIWVLLKLLQSTCWTPKCHSTVTRRVCINSMKALCCTRRSGMILLFSSHHQDRYFIAHIENFQSEGKELSLSSSDFPVNQMEKAISQRTRKLDAF